MGYSLSLTGGILLIHLDVFKKKYYIYVYRIDQAIPME